MLESVTLAQVVELVVKVLIDLAGRTVLDEKATENTLTTHPQNLAIMVRNRISSVVPDPHTKAKRVGFESGGKRTWAYEHPWYPYAYPDHGVGQFGGQQ